MGCWGQRGVGRLEKNLEADGQGSRSVAGGVGSEMQDFTEVPKRRHQSSPGNALLPPAPILCPSHLLAYVSHSLSTLSRCPYPESHPQHLLFLSQSGDQRVPPFLPPDPSHRCFVVTTITMTATVCPRCPPMEPAPALKGSTVPSMVQA